METAPSSERPNPVTPFESLRRHFGVAARQVEGIESGDAAGMQAAVKNPEVWKKTFQRVAMPGENLETCRESYCRELAQTAQELGGENEQVVSFREFLGLPEGEIDYFEEFMKATSWQEGATPARTVVTRAPEPVVEPTREPEPTRAVAPAVEVPRARLNRRESRVTSREIEERRQVLPTRKFVEEIKDALREQGINPDDPGATREKIYDRQFWFGENGFWNKGAQKEGRAVADYTRATRQAVFDDIRNPERRATGHADRADLRRLFGLPGDYRLRYGELEDITIGVPIVDSTPTTEPNRDIINFQRNAAKQNAAPETSSTPLLPEQPRGHSWQPFPEFRVRSEVESVETPMAVTHIPGTAPLEWEDVPPSEVEVSVAGKSPKRLSRAERATQEQELKNEQRLGQGPKPRPRRERRRPAQDQAAAETPTSEDTSLPQQGGGADEVFGTNLGDVFRRAQQRMNPPGPESTT